MSETKTIVCLANSDKNSGTCMAGLVLLGDQVGEWLRVTGPNNSALTGAASLYENGRSPGVLDVIELDLLKPCPILHQTENWEIQPNTRMRYKNYVLLEKNNLDIFVGQSPSKDLWIDGTNEKQNDRVRHFNISRFNDSLRFIYLPSVEIYSSTNYRGIDTVRAKFNYHSRIYDLSITDPEIKEEFLYIGSTTLRNCYATISLANEWKENHYKLVASLIYDYE